MHIIDQIYYLTFRRNSGGMPPGSRATIFIACSHWLKSDADAGATVAVAAAPLALLLLLVLVAAMLPDDGSFRCVPFVVRQMGTPSSHVGSAEH